MRLVILSSMVLTVLVAATGCSVSGQTAQRGTMPPSSVDTSSDPSWNPPDQMDLAIREAKVSQARNDLLVGSLPAPNKREIRGNQLHAAK